MNAKLTALEKNQTWSIVNHPSNCSVIGCKWVYKLKHKADGTIERHKACLVAKGFTQLEGMDFHDTFAPVAKLASIRFILVVAAAQNWKLVQLDVNNAFLHGELDEVIYMDIPPGMVNSKPGQVCLLHKSLYGLRQASRQWYAQLSSFLLLHGFKQSHADHSLFIHNNHDDITILLVYVDNIIVMGNNPQNINHITQLLDQRFKLKNLGDLTYFLGFEIARNKDGIDLSQRKYTIDLLTDTGMLDSSLVSTPMNFSTKFHADGELLPNPTSYRKLIGKLIYLMNSCPDITYVVNHLSQYVSSPTKEHYQVVFKILRYLKRTVGQRIFIDAKSKFYIKAYSDSDWAGCVDTRKSVTGFLVYLGNTLITWRSKKQTIVSRSSCEVEYKALAQTVCEIQWLAQLMHDLNLPIAQHASVYCDNTYAIKIANNPVFHERTKHIEVDCHTIREKIQQGLIKLLPVRTNHQLADILTKALPPGVFSQINSKLGSHNIYCPLAGGVS